MESMALFSRTARGLFGNQAKILTVKKYSMASEGLVNSGKKLAGKTAVVTASTEGIGLAIARKLGQDGAKVIISSRRKNKVDAALTALTAEGLDVLGTVCHVGEEKDRKHLIEFASKAGNGIDILVSNAAVNPHFGPALEASEPVWDKIFNINVKAAFQLTQLVVPEMQKKNGGSITYISSIAAYRPFTFLGIYSVSKTALLGLGKVMAEECAHYNIRVNTVCPGAINTKFSRVLSESDDTKEEILRHLMIKRFGEPEDISGIVSFLSSDEASYITGETMCVTGGFYAHL